MANRRRGNHTYLTVTDHSGRGHARDYVREDCVTSVGWYKGKEVWVKLRGT